MADLGIKKMDDMIGRTDLLDKKTLITHWKTKGVDFNQLLHMPEVPKEVARHKVVDQDHSLEKALDNDLIREAAASINTGKPIKITKEIDNSYRTVGTTLSHVIAKKYGEEGLPDDTISLDFTGSGGQSFAAFLSKGVSIDLKGDANDYFCNHMA